jgi:glycerate kinase
VTSHTQRPLERTPSWRGAEGAGISQKVLIACARFGPRLSADAVAIAIAQGMQEGGLPKPDVCPLQAPDAREEDIRALLDALDFDARMRSARAVVIGTPSLRERTLAGSVTFEIATRARQGGVPAYAVTADDALASFDARILDLQLVLQAGNRTALRGVGRRLTALV